MSDSSPMAEYNLWRMKQGLAPIEEAPALPEGTRTPKRQHNFQLTEEAYEGLKIIAFESGFDNPTRFLEAIGTRKWPN